MIKISLICTVILGSLFVNGCRTGRKATEAEGGKTVFVKINGLPDAATLPANLDFEMSQCIAATNGKKVQDNLQFTSPEIKKGASCVLKGKSLSPAAEHDFISEVGVYFIAKDVTIKEGTGGRLTATANMQTVYRIKTIGSPSVELTVLVQFDEKEKPQGEPKTATLTCSPGFAAGSKYTEKDALNGSFVFSAAFSEAKKEFTCTDIHVVTNGGAQVYRGMFSPALTFKTAADLKISTPVTKLNRVNTSPTEEIDPTIETVFCPDKQIFNETSQKCEPCPATQEFDSYTRTCIDKK